MKNLILFFLCIFFGCAATAQDSSAQEQVRLLADSMRKDYFNGNYAQVKRSGQEAIQIALQSKLPESALRVPYTILGLTYKNIDSNYNTALFYLFNVLSINRSGGQLLLIANSCSNIGSTYEDMKDPEKGLQYRLLALNYLLKAEADKKLLKDAYHAIRENYKVLKNRVEYEKYNQLYEGL